MEGDDGDVDDLSDDEGGLTDDVAYEEDDELSYARASRRYAVAHSAGAAAHSAGAAGHSAGPHGAALYHTLNGASAGSLAARLGQSALSRAVYEGDSVSDITTTIPAPPAPVAASPLGHLLGSSERVIVKYDHATGKSRALPPPLSPALFSLSQQWL